MARKFWAWRSSNRSCRLWLDKERGNGDTVPLINDAGAVMWHTDHLTSYGSDRDRRAAPWGRCGETANCLHSEAPASSSTATRGLQKNCNWGSRNCMFDSGLLLVPTKWTRLPFIHGRHYFEHIFLAKQHTPFCSGVWRAVGHSLPPFPTRH